MDRLMDRRRMLLQMVRKGNQESISTQQIPENFNGINLISSLSTPFIYRLEKENFQKFKVTNKGPFMSRDRHTEGRTS